MITTLFHDFMGILHSKIKTRVSVWGRISDSRVARLDPMEQQHPGTEKGKRTIKDLFFFLLFSLCHKIWAKKTLKLSFVFESSDALNRSSTSCFPKSSMSVFC